MKSTLKISLIVICMLLLMPMLASCTKGGTGNEGGGTGDSGGGAGAAVCGNGTCESGEDLSNCPQDCTIGGGTDTGPSKPINEELFQPDSVKGTFPTIAGIDFSALLSMPDASFPVSGNTIRVSAGSDLVAAVAGARPGDKVVIAPGTYPIGDSDSGFGLSLATNDLVITQDGSGQVILQAASGFTRGVRISGDNIILNGVTIRGFSDVGIELGDGSGSRNTVNNVIISNVTVEAVREGIINYRDNSFDHNILIAEGLTPSVNKLLLENVVITGATVLGFSCNVGPCINVRFNNVAVHNGVTGSGDSGADCIAFERGDNLVFFNVESDHCEADGLDLKASRVAVVNSYFHNTTRNGLKLWRGGDVMNTIVSHTGADSAVVFDGPAKYRILNSIVAHHNEGGVGPYTMTIAYDSVCGVSDSACGGNSGAANCCRTNNLPTNFGGVLDVEITNSVFFKDAGPIYCRSGKGFSVRNSLFNGFAEGNTIFEFGEGGGNRTALTDLSICGSGTFPCGSGNLAYDTNPLFSNQTATPASEALTNWTTQSGSPLRNAGTMPDASTFPTFDMKGNSRTQGSAPDIGPMESP